MNRILRPLVLLLAAAAALLPAVPLDLLYCRCTGTLSVSSMEDGCCGTSFGAVPAMDPCCTRDAVPGAPFLEASGGSASGCIATLRLGGPGTPAPVPAPDGTATPEASALAASPFLLPPAVPAGAAVAAAATPPGLLPPPAAHLRL